MQQSTVRETSKADKSIESEKLLILEVEALKQRVTTLEQVELASKHKI